MPPASFYHQFFRVLLGIVMFAVSLYTTVKSAILAIMTVFLSSLFSSKYPLQIEDIFFTIIILIALAAAILSLLAAPRIVFRYFAHPADYTTTMHAVINTLAVILYWNRLIVSFSSPYEILNLVIAAIASLIYLGSAVAIIRFSRRRDDTTSANSSSHLIK